MHTHHLKIHEVHWCPHPARIHNSAEYFMPNNFNMACASRIDVHTGWGGTNFSVSGCRVKVPEQCCHRLATAIAIRHCDTHLARRVCVRRYITDNWTTYRNTGTALPSLHAATHTPLCLFQENSSAFSQPCPNLRSLSPTAPDCPNHGPPHPTLSNLLPFHLV